MDIYTFLFALAMAVIGFVGGYVAGLAHADFSRLEDAAKGDRDDS